MSVIEALGGRRVVIKRYTATTDRDDPSGSGSSGVGVRRGLGEEGGSRLGVLLGSSGFSGMVRQDGDKEDRVLGDGKKAVHDWIGMY